MLGRQFLKVNGTSLPAPTVGPRTRYKHIENIMTSEAGTDMDDVIRLNKRTVICTFQVSSMWKNKLLTICSNETVSLQIGSETAFTVRPRLQNGDLFDYSYNTPGTDGLYTVSINFEEV